MTIPLENDHGDDEEEEEKRLKIWCDGEKRPARNEPVSVVGVRDVKLSERVHDLTCQYEFLFQCELLNVVFLLGSVQPNMQRCSVGCNSLV